MRRALLVALVLLLPVLALGCGGGEEETTAPEAVEGETPTQAEGDGDAAEGDPAAGRQVFESAGCGNCHTFEPAGATGTTAPNLDDADVSFEEAVEQIRNGGGGMPAFEGDLSDEEIANVAAFVTSGR